MDSLAVEDEKKQVIAQQLRLRRSFMAVGAGLANSLVLLLAWVLGYVHLDLTALLRNL